MDAFEFQICCLWMVGCFLCWLVFWMDMCMYVCLAVGAWMICICYFDVFGLMHVFDILPLVGIDIKFIKWLTV